MTATFRLGRIAGIEIGAHWSWLLVVALVVWSLADGVFPDTNPGLADDTYLAMAIVATLLFFASILLHELGHAFAALRLGIGISSIQLWIFGGMARMDREADSPATELVSEFGSTACKAQYRCTSCLEPFDHVKEI